MIDILILNLQILLGLYHAGQAIESKDDGVVFHSIAAIICIGAIWGITRI